MSPKDHLINTIINVNSAVGNSDQGYATDYGLIISRFKELGMIDNETYENLCDTIAKTFNVIRKEGVTLPEGATLPTVFEEED